MYEPLFHAYQFHYIIIYIYIYLYNITHSTTIFRFLAAKSRLVKAPSPYEDHGEGGDGEESNPERPDGGNNVGGIWRYDGASIINSGV